VIFRRGRFAGVVGTQVDLFEREHASLVRAAVEAERAYDGAEREEAEERYADYLDLVETGTELLAALRDNYASTLEEDDAEQYERAFNRAVAKRLPRFALELEDT
jgi:hypothetical protein